MFRLITSIILLVAFAMQTFHRTVIVLDYYANTTSFAKNCENKAKPVMKCNGKCQMAKKLKEEEKKDQQSPERKLENKNEVISSKSFFAMVPLQYIISHVTYSLYLIDAKPLGHISAIFHPPSLV